MERNTRKSGKGSRGGFPKLPHEIGRQGGKFCPGDSSIPDRGTEKSTWAPPLTKTKGK